jgi:hypothetical protein
MAADGRNFGKLGNDASVMDRRKNKKTGKKNEEKRKIEDKFRKPF